MGGLRSLCKRERIYLCCACASATHPVMSPTTACAFWKPENVAEVVGTWLSRGNFTRRCVPGSVDPLAVVAGVASYVRLAPERRTWLCAA